MGRTRAFLAMLIVTAGLLIAMTGWFWSSYVKTMAGFDERALPSAWWHEAAVGIPLGFAVIALGIRYGASEGQWECRTLIVLCCVSIITMFSGLDLLMAS